VFFRQEYGGKTMTEWACESPTSHECDVDQRTFKAYLARWLAITAQLAPFSADVIMPWLQTSATNAMKVCSGGPPGGIVCGRRWYADKDDGTRDIGNQMTAMSIVQSNLITQVPPPVDVKTGTSIGNAAAGGTAPPEVTADDILKTRPMTAGERAGAWTVTAVLFVVLTGAGGFMISDNEGFKSTWYTNKSRFG
jgi:mannan endo-1,6-alpha-mannosidase